MCSDQNGDGTVDEATECCEDVDYNGMCDNTQSADIPIDPPEYLNATLRADDIELSRDADQRWLFVVDLGSNRVWILKRTTGEIIGSIGGSGHMAGEFTFPHTIVMDSHGDLYVAETLGGRRHQKFRSQTPN